MIDDTGQGKVHEIWWQHVSKAGQIVRHFVDECNDSRARSRFYVRGFRVAGPTLSFQILQPRSAGSSNDSPRCHFPANLPARPGACPLETDNLIPSPSIPTIVLLYSQYATNMILQLVYLSGEARTARVYGAARLASPPRGLLIFLLHLTGRLLLVVLVVLVIVLVVILFVGCRHVSMAPPLCDF